MGVDFSLNMRALGYNICAVVTTIVEVEVGLLLLYF